MLIGDHQDLMDVGGVEELTVLFADIRNFTLLVQHLEPSQLRIFLNSFQSRSQFLLISEINDPSLFVHCYIVMSFQLFASLGFHTTIYHYLSILDPYFCLKSILNKIGELEKLTESYRKFFYLYPLYWCRHFL